MTPLGPLLFGPVVERHAGGGFGARIGRTLTPRFEAEFSFDYGLGSLALISGSVSAVEATRASFVTAWNRVLSGPAQNTQVVTAVSTATGDEGRQAVTTGTLLINLGRVAAVTPYAAVGAGTSPISARRPA